MSYWGELRANWRPLLAATIGVGTGMSLAGTITSAIAPSMVKANGWSMGDFAWVGSLGIFSTLVFPLVGRLADVIGVKRTALIGQVALPIAFLAYSMMSGSLRDYITIFLVQSIICLTTTATVYSRLAVQYVKEARGLALAIVVSGGALSSMIVGPLLNDYVEANGWRAAYQALAIFVTIGGAIVFALIPPERTDERKAIAKRRSARQDYPVILRSFAFWVLAVAMLLCNLPQVLMLTQLKLLMLDNGVSGEGAAVMLTALPFGMLIGRIIAGFAIDRISPSIVALIMMGIPSIGLFVIASSYDSYAVLTLAVISMGFAFGAEGDIVAFLVARHFGVSIYSSVMGLMTAVISLSASGGAFLLSKMLAANQGFNTFLVLTGCTVVAGASLLLFLRRAPTATEALT